MYPLAHMSAFIRALTLLMLALPLAFFGSAAFGNTFLLGPALILVALYVWVWLRFRPSCFIIGPDGIEVRWPLKRRYIARASITDIRIVNTQELRGIAGAGVRIGVGGLWGGFGWLWTQRRGIAQMYVSRTDRYVWIERGAERPWLITPENPEAFVRALR